MTAPRVSIILPTYARPAALERCLTGLAALSGKVPFEVVVVDDGSPEPVARIAERFSGRVPLKAIRQENAGPASARNAGARASRGTILAFTDDDCEPVPDWIEGLTAPLAERPDALVGGRTVNAVESDVCASAAQDLVSFLYEHAGRSRRPGGTPRGFDFFTSNNMACPRDAFLALGGFDDSFPLAAGEDRDFGLRYKASGRPLLYAPDAVVRHHHEMHLAGFLRQQRNYGRGARHLRVRRIEKAEEPVPFEGLRFYSNMLSYPFRAGSARPMRTAALLFLSQVALVAGFAQEARQARRADREADMAGARPPA